MSPTEEGPPIPEGLELFEVTDDLPRINTKRVPMHRSDDIREYDRDGELVGPYCLECSEPWPCFKFCTEHPDELDAEVALIASHPYPGVLR